MPNIQVTHDASLNNARSESSIVINPNNPSQIVSGSKKFRDIHNYDFTLATQFSNDGGLSWHDSADLSLTNQFETFQLLTDPALAWDDSGNVFLVGLSGKNPPTFDGLGIEIYKSTDGGQTWSNPTRVHSSATDDKQWAAGDANPNSPFKGRVYAVWWDYGDNTLRFARTLDHGGSWIGAGTAASASAAGTAIASKVPTNPSPEINVASDGTIYIAIMWGSDIRLLVSTDGGDTFQFVSPPAKGVTRLESGGLQMVHLFPVFPGGTFRVGTFPTACVSGQMVAVAWADFRDGVSRIYYAISNDGGASWQSGPKGSGLPLLRRPIPKSFQHFHPQIVIDPNGIIGCAFYEFGPKPVTPLIEVIMAFSSDSGASFNQVITVTDEPWNPAVDAPWSHHEDDNTPPDSSLTFIGEYFGLDASNDGFHPLWTDTRTGIQELWTAIVPEKKCIIIVDRDPIGQDEILARRKQPTNTLGGLPVPDAFRVVVDGFTAAALGVTDASSTLSAPPAFNPPVAGMTIIPAGNSSDTGGYGPGFQLFTFFYEIGFPDSSDPEFNFLTDSSSVEIDVTVGGVSNSALLTLIKQPDPFLLHGDPAWLSIDLRVFGVRPHETWFGVPMAADASGAPDFIQQVMKGLTDGQGTAGGQSFDDPNVLSPDEDRSKLYLQPKDHKGVPVFNFALARVRYIGLIGANNVRAFFRLRQTQVTYAPFDYPPGAQYRRAPSNPNGQPIPLAGIDNGEYVTVPCFALPRVDSTVIGMDQQTDSGIDGSGNVVGNVQKISANADGSEVDTFFGCWIDINQPDNRLPVEVPPNQDGPFDLHDPNPKFRPVSLKAALARNLHLCLIAEINFDPTPIPFGKDPSNWDKLAQRNIAWSDAGSAQAVTTFELRPTAQGLTLGQAPDELMIDWGNTPKGRVASIYLPAVSVDDILTKADRMYSSHHLTRGDDHTLHCKTGGITYVPIPPGGNVGYAGLLSVDLPDNLPQGEAYTVAVRQITNAFGKATPPPPPPPAIRARRRARTALAVTGGDIEWRRVLGAFQLTIPVHSKQSLLLGEERDLSVLRWIGQAIPTNNRWYPVFRRYLDKIAGRVKAFGGEPSQILPSPTGDGITKHRHPEEREAEKRIAFTGKVISLAFDRFGDFEGFVLDTEDGERRFGAREPEIERVVNRAWAERILTTVIVELDSPHRPEKMVLHCPPLPFKH